MVVRGRTVAVSILVLAGWLLGTASLHGQTLGAGILYIDTHAHLVGATGRDCDYDFAVQDALAAMDRLGIQKSLLMPAPDEREGCDFVELAQVVQRFPQRLAFLAGGRSLNPMIQAAVRSGELTDDTRALFEQTATAIVQSGAVGFGEMAVLHLSYASTHPFEEAPPDHPLFLLLADIAAQLNVPIDLHMDTVLEDMPFSDAQLAVPLTVTSSNNPDRLTGNVAAFERLLAYNRGARIIWDHVGADGTGLRTPELSRRLLEAHPNLYMQLRMVPGNAPSALLSAGGPPAGPPGQAPGQPRPKPPAGGPPLGPGGAPSGPPGAFSIKPEWLDVIRAFPDRFTLGSDRFYHPPGVGQPFITRISPAQQEAFDRLYASFLEQLPPDLARLVGYENAVQLYRLN
jgi:hypothetical protein